MSTDTSRVSPTAREHTGELPIDVAISAHGGQRSRIERELGGLRPRREPRCAPHAGGFYLVDDLTAVDPVEGYLVHRSSNGARRLLDVHVAARAGVGLADFRAALRELERGGVAGLLRVDHVSLDGAGSVTNEAYLVDLEGLPRVPLRREQAYQERERVFNIARQHRASTTALLSIPGALPVCVAGEDLWDANDIRRALDIPRHSNDWVVWLGRFGYLKAGIDVQFLRGDRSAAYSDALTARGRPARFPRRGTATVLTARGVARAACWRIGVRLDPPFLGDALRLLGFGRVRDVRRHSYDPLFSCREGDFRPRFSARLLGRVLGVDPCATVSGQIGSGRLDPECITLGAASTSVDLTIEQAEMLVASGCGAHSRSIGSLFDRWRRAARPLAARP